MEMYDLQELANCLTVPYGWLWRKVKDNKQLEASVVKRSEKKTRRFYNLDDLARIRSILGPEIQAFHDEKNRNYAVSKYEDHMTGFYMSSEQHNILTNRIEELELAIKNLKETL